MITYGLVKQIGPYAVDYPASYKRNNAVDIAPRYPYNSIVGYGEKSAYAAREVEDKEGVATPKLPQFKYQDEKKQYGVMVNMFQPTFGLSFSVENENMYGPAAPPNDGQSSSSGPSSPYGSMSEIKSDAGSEPVARLSDVLRRSSETANELLSQRESLRSLSEQFLSSENIEAPTSSAYAADLSGSDSRPSSGSSMSIDGSSYNANQVLQPILNALQLMDRRLAESSISDPTTRSTVLMDIDSTYRQLTPDSALVRGLLELRLNDVEDEIRNVAGFTREVEEAVRSAASPVAASTASRQSLLSQAVSTAAISAPSSARNSIHELEWALGQSLVANAYERQSTASLRSNRSRADDDMPRALARLQERYPDMDINTDVLAMFERAGIEGFDPYRMPEALPNYLRDVPPMYEIPPAYEALNNRLGTIRRRADITSSSEEQPRRRSTRRRRSARVDYRGMQNTSASSGSNYSG